MTFPMTSFAFRAKDEPAQVIPFPAGAARRARRVSQDEETRTGQILLYTGIRYERIAEPDEDVKPKRKRS